MRSSLIKEVEAYWQGLCPLGDIPNRSSLDPRGFERALDHTFLLSRHLPRVAKVRLGCRQLNDLMGLDMRGMLFTSIIDTTARSQVSELLENLFLKPQIVGLSLVGSGTDKTPGNRAEVLLMPMRDHHGKISSALGCFVAEVPVGTVPHRFAIASTHIRRLSLMGENRPSTHNTPVPEFAEPKIAFENHHLGPDKKKGASVKRPILRLVKSDN